MTFENVEKNVKTILFSFISTITQTVRSLKCHNNNKLPFHVFTITHGCIMPSFKASKMIRDLKYILVIKYKIFLIVNIWYMGSGKYLIHRLTSTIRLSRLKSTRLPSSVYRLPVYQIPPTVYQLPSTTYRLPPTVLCLPSPVTRLLSLVTRHPSTIYRRHLTAYRLKFE